jgi:hypothetical protein
MTTDTLERTDNAPKIAARDLETDGIISAYLYYLDFNGGTEVAGETIYEFYDHPDAVIDKDRLALQLIANAHTGGNSPPPCSFNHLEVMLRRKSYLIIVAANAPAINQNNPITFSVKNVDGDTNNGNHTFERVIYYPLSLGPTQADNLQIITCENKMQSMENGGNLGRKEWEDFEFTLQFEGVAPLQLEYDSGGTNMGPPVPPPVRLAR